MICLQVINMTFAQIQLVNTDKERDNIDTLIRKFILGQKHWVQLIEADPTSFTWSTYLS